MVRTRLVRKLVVVGVLALGAGMLSACINQPPPGAPDTARDLFNRINSERHTRGLPLLNWDPGLAASAQAWAGSMRDGGMRHSMYAPENIYSGGGGAAWYGNTGSAHRGFMASDGHRTNILAGGYDRVGVGVVCAGDTMFVVEQFGLAPGASGFESTPAPAPMAAGDGVGPSC